MNKNFFASIVTAAVLAICAVTPAYATPVSWTLNDVVFADGASATGSFIYDADTHRVSGVNISVTAGTFSAYTYSSIAFVNTFGANSFAFIDQAVGGIWRYLDLQTTSALTNDGGITALLTGTRTLSYECDNCTIFRYITSGSLQTASSNVPEPATLGLLGLGLAGMALRRRKTAR